MCSQPTLLTETKPKCSYKPMDKLITGMEATLSKMTAGQIKPDTASLVPYSMSDTWFNCSDLVTRTISTSSTQATGTVTHCPYPYPWRNMCPGESEEAYCKAVPEDKWCKNACCFWKLQETQCCGPTTVSWTCLLYTSPSPRDQRGSRMPSSA